MTPLGVFTFVMIWSIAVFGFGIVIGRMQMHKEMTYRARPPGQSTTEGK